MTESRHKFLTNHFSRMKRIIYGLATVVLAVGGVAATKAKPATQAGTYYFAYTAGGANLAPYQTQLSVIEANPSQCQGGSTNCAGVYTSYATFTSSGVTYYEPAGNPEQPTTFH